MSPANEIGSRRGTVRLLIALVAMACISTTAHAVVGSLRMTGGHNGWSATNDGNSLGGSWPDNNIWVLSQTMAAGTNTWNYRSDGNDWNKWGPYGGNSGGLLTANLNTVYAASYNNGSNNDPGAWQTTFSASPKQYTFRFLDNNYASTTFIVMETDNAPRIISSVANIADTVNPGPVKIGITMNATVSGNEKILLVYTQDNWASRDAVTAVFASGTTYEAEIPAQPSGVKVEYYIITTTVSEATFDGYSTDNQRNLVTLKGNNNGGSNYSFNRLPPTHTMHSIYPPVGVFDRGGRAFSDSEIIATTAGASAFLTWDTTYVFVAFAGGTGDGDKYNVLFDINPTTSNGATSDFSGRNVGTTNHRPDVAYQIVSSTVNKYPSSGTGWGGGSNVTSSCTTLFSYNSSGGTGDTIVVGIPRSNIGLSSIADTCTVWLYASSGADVMWANFDNSTYGLDFAALDSGMAPNDTKTPAAFSSFTVSPARSGTDSFTITVNGVPADASGFAGFYYKVGSAPSTNQDGTFARGSSAAGVRAATAAGSDSVYVWPADRALNGSKDSQITSTTRYTKINYWPDSVVINEILAVDYSSLGSSDSHCFIELYNASSSSVDVSGWVITDTVTSWTIPASTTMPAGSYLVYWMVPGTNYRDSYGTLHCFPGTKTTIMPGAANKLSSYYLFRSSTFTAANLVDFIQISTTAPGAQTTPGDSIAVDRWVWDNDARKVATTTMTGVSIARVPDGYDVDSTAEWVNPGSGPSWSPGFSNGNSVRANFTDIGAGSTISFKASNYSSAPTNPSGIGDTIYIYLAAAQDPNVAYINNVPVLVRSATDTIVVTLREAAVNSKTFIGSFYLTSTLAGKANNALYVVAPDIIYCTSVLGGGASNYPSAHASDSLYVASGVTTPTVTATASRITRSSTGVDSTGILAGDTYHVTATFTDAGGIAQLNNGSLFAALKNAGNALDSVVFKASGNTISVVNGSESVYETITFDSTSSGNSITCTWTFTPKWTWSSAPAYTLSVRAIDDGGLASAWTDSTASYDILRTIVFSGTLAGSAAHNGTIVTDKYVRGSENITWSGLTVVYAGSNGLTVNDNYYDIRIANDNGTTTDQATSAVFSTVFAADAASDATEQDSVYLVGLVTGALFSDTKASPWFRVDAGLPTIHLARDNYTMKDTALQYGRLFNVDFYDTGGSGVDSAYIVKNDGTGTKTIFYRTCTTATTVNWVLPSDFALSAGANTCRIGATDTAGNIAAYSTITINFEDMNATNGDVTDWRGDEVLDTRSSTLFRVTWDDTRLYFTYGGSDGDLGTDGDLVVHFRTSSPANSTTTSNDFDGTHTLPFAANYALIIEDGTTHYFRRYDGSTPWADLSEDGHHLYGGHSGNKNTEYAIPWSQFGGKPTSLHLIAWRKWDNASNIYLSFPVTNRADNATGVTLTDYYYWADLSDTVAPTIARMDSLVFMGPGATDVASPFAMTLGAVNAAGDTLPGYNGTYNLTISGGGTLSTTSTTLTSGDIGFSQSVTGVTGAQTITATAQYNSGVTATNGITVAALDSPTYVINTTRNQWFRSNPALDVDFTDNTNLDDIFYQIDAYNGTWTPITSDGSTQTGQNISGATFTDNFYMTTAHWNALSQGLHTIYFKATDDGGKETGTGAITAVGLTFYKDDVAPVLAVNRDSHTLKSDGRTYGKLFNVDFSDATGHVKDAWIERVNGTTVSDTWYIFSNNSTNSWTDNWAVGDTFTQAMTMNAVTVCKVRARDTAGNVATAGTLYIQREIINAADGDTSDWLDDESLDNRKGNALRVAWDDTCLFISYGGPDGSVYQVGGDGADFFFYIQTSNVSTADSTYIPVNWGGYGNVHRLPFGANAMIALEGDYTPVDGSTEDNLITEFQTVSGGTWSGNIQCDSIAYLGRHSSNNRNNEYRIPWSRLGGFPDSMLLIFYHQWEGEAKVYNALPPGNPAGHSSVVTFTDYYYIPILKDTVAPASSLRLTTSPAAVRVDGDTADWGILNNPTGDDTSRLANREFIWQAALNDQRTDFTPSTDYDLRTLRIRGDTNQLYFYTRFQDVTSSFNPMVGIAIDTDLVAGSGQHEIGGNAFTSVADTAKWEMCFLANASIAGWWDIGFSNGFQTDGASAYSAYSDVGEVSIPWRKLFKSSAIGDSLPRRLRLTVITGQRDNAQPLDFKAGSQTSRAMDGVDLASRKTGGLFLSEVTNPDTNLGYYFEVDFDTWGRVIPNRIDFAGADTTKTDSVTKLTLRTVDFNGVLTADTTMALGAGLVVTHNGRGNLYVQDSQTAWSSGLKYIQFRYDVEETITITCTETLHGRVGSFTIGFLRDTAGPNAWYVNDSSTTGDSFSFAAGTAAARGLARWHPTSSLEKVLGQLTAGDTVYIDAGTYHPAMTLTLTADSVFLIGKDSLTTIIDWNDVTSGSGFSLYANDRDSVLVRDLMLREAYDGLNFVTSDQARIERVHATANGRDGFRFVTDVDSLVVVASRATSNGASGFYLADADSSLLFGALAGSNTANGFHLAAGAETNRIEYSSSSADAVGFRLDAVTGNLLRAVSVSSATSHGLHLTAAPRNTIESATVATAGGNGILLASGSDTNTIRANSVAGATAAAFEADASDGNNFSYNTVTSGSAQGFLVENGAESTSFLYDSAASVTRGFVLSADSASIIGCTAAATTETGFLVTGTGNRIVFSAALGAGRDGFAVHNGVGNTLQDNRADTSTGAGFTVSGTAGENAFLRNTARFSTGAGLRSAAANANRFHSNVAHSGLSFGIQVAAGDAAVFMGNQSDSNHSGELRVEAGVANLVFTRNNMSAKTGGTTLVSTALNNLDVTRNWWNTRDSVVIAAAIAGTGAGTVYSPWRLRPADTSLAADTVAPVAPDSVSANNAGMETIVVRWSAVTADETSDHRATGLTGYRIWRWPSATSHGGDTRLWDLRGAVGSGTTSFTDSGLTYGTRYSYRVTAYDDNTNWPNESFYSDTIAWDTTLGRPVILISEYHSAYTTGDKDSDFVEFYVKDDQGRGNAINLSGWKLYTIIGTGSRTLRKTFGDLTVRTGAFVTVYTGYAASPDETSEGADSRVIAYIANSNSLYGTTDAGGDVLFELEAPGSAGVVDVLAVSNGTWNDAVQGARLATLVSAGLWGPDGTVNSTVSNAAIATKGISLRRDSTAADANTKDDWSSETQTPGNFPFQRYEAKCDSMVPTLGLPVTLTVWALDSRGDTIVNHRDKPTLTVTNGAVTPTRLHYAFENDLVNGTSGETTTSVTFTGYNGNVTLTIGSGAHSCTIALAVRAPLESFTLAPQAPVQRGAPFPLRIRANTTLGTAASLFAGDVTLSTDKYAITPSTVTFTAADAGETTIMATLSGVGVITVTASADGKTGTCTAVPIPDTNLVLSEVTIRDYAYAGNDRDEWFEIWNRGGSKSLNGYVLRFLQADSAVSWSFPNVTATAGQRIVVHLLETGSPWTDTHGVLHLIANRQPFFTTPAAATYYGALALYTSSSLDSTTITDFVAWSGQTNGIEPRIPDTVHAVPAGIWTEGVGVEWPFSTVRGASIELSKDGGDSHHPANWERVNDYAWTPGLPNENTEPTGLSSIVILGGGNDTCAPGDTLTVRAVFDAEGNPNRRDVTNVFITSNTDLVGLVIPIRQIDNTSLTFEGAFHVSTVPRASNSALRIIAATAGDSIRATWTGGGATDTILCVAGPAARLFCTAPSAVIRSEAFDLEISAHDLAGNPTSGWTGTITLTLTDSEATPSSIPIIAADGGDTSTVIAVGSAPGAVTLTAAAAGMVSATASITVIAPSNYLFNEILANPTAIDWNGIGGATEPADEAIEIINTSDSYLTLAGAQIVRVPGTDIRTLQDSIPPRGWVTTYMGTAGNYSSYHFDSAGTLVASYTNLSGYWNALLNSGGTIRLYAADSTLLAQMSYPTLTDDVSYGRAPDGFTGAFRTFAKPSLGVSPTGAPNNRTNNNTVFAVHAVAETVAVGTPFTLSVALLDRNDETVTTFSGSANVGARYNGTLSVSTLSFTNGVCSTSVSFSAANGGESTGIYVWYLHGYGLYAGYDSLTIAGEASPSAETSRVTVTQAIADGRDTALIQVVLVTGGGGAIAGKTVTCTTSKGTLDTLSASTQVSNSFGVCTFTVVSRDTTPSKVYITVDGVTLWESPVIYWLSTAESGVKTGLGTQQTLSTLDDDSHFLLHPVWHPQGLGIAYLAKSSDTVTGQDTWNVYWMASNGLGFDQPIRLTGVAQRVFPGSKVAFGDALAESGVRLLPGQAGDGVLDVIFSAWTAADGSLGRTRDLYAVRLNGADSEKTQAQTVRIAQTASGAYWTSPVVYGETMYAVHSGSIYRVPLKGSSPYLRDIAHEVFVSGSQSAFMIDGFPYSAMEIALLNENVAAVMMVFNKTGDSVHQRFMKRSEILILKNLNIASYNYYTSIDNNRLFRVNRPDSMICHTLSWETTGRMLSWSRDISGNFSYNNIWFNHNRPEVCFSTTNFDVEGIYVKSDLTTPNLPVSLINNNAGMDDIGAGFAPTGRARVSHISYNRPAGTVKLKILDIDGAAEVNENGGILFENGRMTVVVDEGDSVSGSLLLRVQRPAAVPSNITPESVALTGNAREFFPAGQTFADSITVILYYDATDLADAGITNGTASEYTLSAWWYNPTSGVWQNYNGVVDPTDGVGYLGSITFQTNHFSIYGVGKAATLPHEAVPVSPARGATFTTRRPTFTWRHSDPVSRPQVAWNVRVSTDSAFATVLFERSAAGAETSYTANADVVAAGDSILFWQVRTAAVPGAWGQWSRVDSWFRITYRVPAAPVLGSPAAGVETRAFPAIAWTHQDLDGHPQTAVQYALSLQPDFSVVPYDDYTETTASSLVVSHTLASGTWYVRVRTFSQNGAGAWSESRAVVINRAPLAPAAATGPETTTSPNPSWSWTHVSPETMTQGWVSLNLYADAGRTVSLQNVEVETSATTLRLTGDRALGVRGNRRVYWSLRTATAERLYGPAAEGSFWLSLNAPLAPTLVGPANALDTTATTLRLSWNHSDSDGDPQSYALVRLARDTNFANTVLRQSVPGAGSSLDVSNLSGTYFWRVATADTHFESDWSATRSFTVVAERLAPVITSVAGTPIVTTPYPTVSWTHRHPNNAAQTAALVEFSLDPSFATTWRSIAVPGSASSLTLGAADSLYLLGETTVRMRVRTAVLGTDYGPVSTESSFTLRLSLPSTPGLETPADSTSTRNRAVEFIWRHVSPNDSLPQARFDLWLGRDTLPAHATVTERLQADENGGAMLYLPGGRWFWQVRTANIVGWGPWSEARILEVDTKSLAPTLLSPASGAILTSPFLRDGRWIHNDPTGAAQSAARLLFSLDTAFTSPVTRTVLGAADSWSATTIAESLPWTGDRTIYWTVQTASFGADFGHVARESSFLARFNPPQAPVLTPPAEFSRERLPVLQLQHVDAESDSQVGVRVQIARDAGFTNLVLDLRAETTATRFTPAAPLAGGRHWWRAATADAVGIGAWSAADDFTVDTATQWTRVEVISDRVLPVGETRVLELRLVSDSGAPIAWTGAAEVTVGGFTWSGSSFTPTATGASRLARFDTAGRYTVTVREGVVSGADSLHVLALPAAVTGDTWIVLAGSSGVGQKVLSSDTRLTVIASRPAGADSTMTLRLVLGTETVLVAGLAPSSFDTRLAYFTPSGLNLVAGLPLKATVARGAETVAVVEAQVFAAPGAAAVFAETPASGGGIRIDLPAGVSDTPVWFTIRRALPRDSFVRASRGLGRNLLESSVVEITAVDLDGNPVEIFRNLLTLGLPTGNGNNLRVAFIRNGEWVELQTSYNALLGLAQAQTNHLSVWGLTVGGAGNIQDVVLYPNPWRSDRGVTDANNDAYGLKFDHLPAGSVRFRIFTISGELVLDGSLDPSTMSATSAGGALKVINVGGTTGQVTRWNLRNQHNNHVASGLYLIQLDHATGRKILKFAVIR